MFFPLLLIDQSENMTNKWHVHMTKDGRISLAGLSSAKCEYLADAIIFKLTASAVSKGSGAEISDYPYTEPTQLNQHYRSWLLYGRSVNFCQSLMNFH